MKQQGQTWYTPDGKPTLSKYLPTHEKLFEKLVQKIAAEAEAIDQRLFSSKKMFVDICKEALRNSPNKDVQRRFTFNSFDREYKIEYDIQEENVRVYRATKANPGSKDYDLINLDLNTKSTIMLDLTDPMFNQPIPDKTEKLWTEENVDKYNNMGSIPPTKDDIKWAKEAIKEYEKDNTGNPGVVAKMLVDGVPAENNNEK